MESCRERALERIKEIVLEVLAGVDARVYLFGSSATGRVRRSSDIDVAVESEDRLPARVLSDLRESLDGSTIPYEVEVVDLSEASREFRDRVKREGIVWKG